MGTLNWDAQLKHLTNSERLALIEAATRLIREDLAAGAANEDEDAILHLAGCLTGNSLSSQEIDDRLYL